MPMEIIFAYPPSQYALPYCKFVFCSCANCPRIDIPGQESDRRHYNKSPAISFHGVQCMEDNHWM